MAYGPLCQCAFMAGPPQFQKKAPAKDIERVIRDKVPPYEPPQGCEPPPPGAFTLYAFDVEDAKADPTSYSSRSMSLDNARFCVFGSSQEYEGQVYDGHKSVLEQHVALFFMRGKWYLKAINGTVHIESMTLHPHLHDSDNRPTKRYTSAGRIKIRSIGPIDTKQKLTREFRVFRLERSGRRFWVDGPLTLGDGETEEVVAEPARDRKEKRKHEASAKEAGEGRHKEKEEKRERERERSRTRSRSRKRRR